MYAIIRSYETDPAAADLVLRRVNEDFVPLVRAAPGFIAYYALHAGQGRLVSVSVFADQRTAERSNLMAAEWVAQKLGPLIVSRPPQLMQVMAGEVGAWHLALPPAGP